MELSAEPSARDPWRYELVSSHPVPWDSAEPVAIEPTPWNADGIRMVPEPAPPLPIARIALWVFALVALFFIVFYLMQPRPAMSKFDSVGCACSISDGY